MKTQIKKPQAALSLAATSTIAFLTFGVLMLSISGGLQLFSGIQTQQLVISSYQQLIAQEAARSVSSFIQEKFSVLETAIWLTDPATASPEEQKLMLDSLLGLQRAFRKLALLNTQDQAVAQATRLALETSWRLTDQIDGNMLAQIHQGEKYISPIYIDPVTSEPLVIMAVPVTDVFGAFKGSLVVQVNLKFMWDLVDQLKVGKTGRAYVVDRQGNLIAFGDTARVLKGENVGHLEAVREFIHNPATARATGASMYPGITGAMVVGTYVPLGTPDWAVVTEVPWAEAYQTVIREAVASFGITLGMTVLAGLLGVFVARRLAVPLVHLMETSTRIAGGERELQAVVSGPREVASLAMAFNSMTAQLRHSLESLEQQVVEVQRAEESLRQANETLQALVDYSPVAIIMFDLDSHVLLWNNAAEKMYGWTAQEALGELIPFVPEDKREEQRAIRERVTQGEILTNLELERRRKDGSRILIGVSIAPLRDATGSVYAHMSITTDITERKRAEEALQESEHRFRTLAEASFEGIALTERGVFVDLNDQLANMLGYARSELIGQPVMEVVAPESRDLVAEAIRSGRLEPYEHLALRKDGTVFPVEARARTTQMADRQVRVTAIRDITEHRRAEAQLERNLRETRVRLEVSQALAGAETEDEVLDALIQYVGLYLPAHVAILTFDRTGSELAVILRRRDTFESGLNVLPIGTRFPASRFTIINLLRPNQPFVSNDFLADERVDFASREVFRPAGVASYAMFPLTAGNEWMGFIGVTAKPTGYFDEEKQHLYQTLAEQGAVALHAARLRETIRESQQRLSLLMQQSPLAVIEWNTDLQVVAWNPAAERIFGYTREEALGRRAAGFIVPEEMRSQTDQVWQAVLAQKGSTHSINDNLTKDGRLITCEWFNAPLVGADSKAIGIASLVQDITERKRAEEALRESEEKYRTLIEQSLQGLVVVQDFRIVFANTAFAKISGYTVEELLSLTPEQAIGSVHPEDLALVLGRFQDRLGGKTAPPHYEYRVFRKDGTMCWLEVRADRIEYHGQPAIQGAIIDITERKRAEEALRESEEKFRTFTESAPVAIMIYQDYHCVYANPEAEQITGYTRQELDQVTFVDFVHPDYKDMVIEGGTAVERGESLPHKADFKIITKNGNEKWLDGGLEMIDYAGKRAALISATDITERKQAEEALHESEERYRRLAEAAHDMIFIINREGNVDYANSFATRQFGRLPEEIIGKAHAELFPSDNAERQQVGLRRVFEAGQPLYVENPTQFPNQTLWLGTWLVPIKDEAGQVKSILGVSRDITERKQAEEVIRRLNAELEQRVIERTAQLEAANKELEAFTYSVSHDLRAPLRAIDGYTRILVEDYEPSLDAEGQRVCAVVRGETRRMGQLIDNLLAFSRLSRATMQPSPIDMATLVNSIFSELTTPKDRQRIDFRVDPLPPAAGDPTLIRQVWLNLLANAVKFSSKRERAVITVGGQQDAGENTYWVRDNGAGFDMQYADKLFGVFQRLHSEREFPGTGVGLAIVQRVIHRHGGRVWAEGQVDQEATFFFTLPQRKD